LKKAGLSEFKVFAIEGEGALTAGGSHEAKNGAWAMVLATFTGWWTGTILALMIEDIFSVFGGPDEWFASHG